MLGIPCATERARPDQSPKGQIPFLDDDGTRIADSHLIREHLEKKLGKDLDAHLDARQRAEAWAIERMLDEVTALGDRSLSARSVLLGDKPYLFGEKPAGVDATAFAVLAGILTPFFESPLRRKALGHANLVAHTARRMNELFPEHPWDVGC